MREKNKIELNLSEPEDIGEKCKHIHPKKYYLFI